MATEPMLQAPTYPRIRRTGQSRWPGILMCAAGVALSWVSHEIVGAIGVLTWAVLFGAVAANTGILPRTTAHGLQWGTRKFLRVGVVLLGCSLPLGAIAGLGLPVVALVVGTLVTTLVLTYAIGLRMGLRRPRSLLIATGIAICGASAVAAMQDTADSDDDDVASAIAMVTLFGTISMLLFPLLQAPLGLGDQAYALWAGASVHEVGQVVAAASPAGATAVGIAIVVKLTRVLMLAPVVATVGVLRRRRSPQTTDARPPLVPLFVLGFLACVALRSLGLIPDTALPTIEVLQTLTLAAALFGLGTGVHLKSLAQGSLSSVATATAGTLIVSGVALAGVLVVVGAAA